MTIVSYDNECFCMDSRNTPTIILPCKHNIHLKCAKQMINDTCPYRCQIPMGVNSNAVITPPISMSRRSYFIVFILTLAHFIYIGSMIYLIFFDNIHLKYKIVLSLIVTIDIIVLYVVIYSFICACDAVTT